MRIRLESGSVAMELELDDGPTARAIAAALPFESLARTWGEEVYFSTPVSAALEPDAKQVVDPGTVCFWTEGDAIALPWGRTPISTDHRPKLASPCSVLGRVAGDPAALARIAAGAKVRLSAA